jgi:hypothetical protein
MARRALPTPARLFRKKTGRIRVSNIGALSAPELGLCSAGVATGDREESAAMRTSPLQALGSGRKKSAGVESPRRPASGEGHKP